MNKRFMSIILVVSTFLFLLTLSGVSAQTYNFNSNNTTSDFQSVIDHDTDSDLVINLADGNYNFNQINVTRNATIKGNSKGNVKINGPGTGTLFNITSTNVRIINLTISGFDTAIKSNSGDLTIIDNNITSSSISIDIRSTGADLKGINIENNTINSLISNDTNGAVYIYSNYSSDIINVSLVGNNISSNGLNNSNGVLINTPGCRNYINLFNNNINGTSYGFYLYGYNNKNSNIDFNNNNITGMSYFAVYLMLSNSNNSNINFINNNIRGIKSDMMTISAFSIYAQFNNNFNLTVINNNITGGDDGVSVDTSYSNNTNLTFSNNDINGTYGNGFSWSAPYSKNITIMCDNNIINGMLDGFSIVGYICENSNITFENNNVVATVYKGVNMVLYTNNNNIDVLVNNNNVTGRTEGIFIQTYQNNNTNLIFENNNIKEADNGVSIDLYLANNTNITFENNSISGISQYGVFLSLDYGNNNNVVFSNVTLTGAVIGIYLGASNSKNSSFIFENNSIIGISAYGLALNSYSTDNISIIFSNNNIMGFFLGVLLTVYNNNNSNITFLKNNITGNTFGVYIPSSEGNISGVKFLNNVINSFSGDGFYFCSGGDLPTAINDFIISGNTIFAPNGAGLNLTDYIAGTLVNVTVNYNHILALFGVNITGFNDNSSFDYNWWGFNDISSLIFGINTNNHYILNINNLTSLNDLKIGDSVKFMFLVLNNTLTNDGVDQLPYFVINGTFNGQEFLVNNTSNFTSDFTIAHASTQVIDGTLDNQDVNFEFSANKADTNSTIIVSNATFGDNVAIYGQLANYAGINFVNITVDGVNYAVPVNTTGGWNLTYFTNHTGDIPVVVSFAGNDNFNAFSNFKNFNVVKLATNSSIIILNATAGKTTIIRGVFVDKNGKPVTKASLTVIIGGKSYNVITSNNGSWNLSYTPPKAGKFIAEVKYLGNNDYLGFTNTINYAVSKGSDVPTKPDIRLVKVKHSKAIRYGNIVYMKFFTFKNYGNSGSEILSPHVLYKNLKYNLWKVYNKKLKYKYVDNKIKFKISLKSGKTFKLKIKVYRPII